MQYILLLWKRLRSEISDDESSQLEAWLNQAHENKQEQQKIEQIWEKSGTAGKEFKVNLDSDFAKIQARIKDEENNPAAEASTFRVWRKSLLRVAAALALLLAAFWLLRSPEATTAPTLFAESTEGTSKMVTLPDGSKIWLHDQARLDYPKDFEDGQRLVRLSGEAFFEIAHDASKPFKVLLPDGTQVEVLGTQFSVRSKPEEPKTEVLVKNGKVRFSAPNSPNKNIVLVANQKGEFIRKNALMVATAVNTLNELAWHEGGLSFAHTPLSTVFYDFEKHFNIHIDTENKSLLDCTYSAPLINQEADEALQAISIVFNMKLIKTGKNSYKLAGGRCN